MPSDLTVPRVNAATAATDTARNRSTPPPEPRPPATSPAGFPNPVLRLDAGLALVVIEFRDETGAVRNTIPTQNQLDAYRSWDRSRVGEPPPGAPRAGAPREGAAKAGAPAEAGSAPAAPPPETTAVKDSETFAD